MADIYQVFVKLLDGKHTILNFSSPSISSESIKHRLYSITAIPIHHQLLVSNGRQFEDGDQTLTLLDGGGPHHIFPPTVHLLLRLRGGKGGFGSLLRGAATKAGQKKTNNFDACRDMSGRRLRHVNAERRLEEWAAGADERRLEKTAEEFIKKKAKEAKKAGGGSEADKYVEKYVKDSAKCMEEVEKSVRESLGSLSNSKRKASGAGGSEAKRLKIWMGKRKADDSDSDCDDTDEDNDDNEENEKSVLTNNGNHSDSSREAERSSGSVTGGKLEEEYSGGSLPDSGSEEEKESVGTGNVEFHGSTHEGTLNGETTLEIHEESMTQNKVISSLEMEVVGKTESVQAEEKECNDTPSGALEARAGQPSISGSGEGGALESGAADGEVNANSKFELVVHAETVATSTNKSEMEKPLNFDEFSSAVEMEVLGMERLKTELQARGLKCGGTLQERAARLFLLKTTPVEMLPKKLIARK